MSRSRQILFRKTFLVTPVACVVLAFPTLAGAQALNACDLNSDGAVNIVDVQLMTNMTLGTTSCSANIAGPGVCNTVVVQALKDAVLTGKCVPHSVTLNWTASPSTNVAGYWIYRSSQTGGPYTKLNAAPVTGTTFLDIAVQAGQTYYYVTTAVDSSNNESVYSNQATAVVPTP